MELLREKKAKIFKDFGISDNDTGSSPVQIALLSQKITVLSDHLKKFSKDSSSKRGLLTMLAERRKLLRYFERENEAGYKDIIKRLGLKK
jgi:small subunit ribosomal protein S15